MPVRFRRRILWYCTEVVPRELPDHFVTSREIMAVAKITPQTIKKWIRYGLLPRPVRVHLGFPKGSFFRFPAVAIEYARWVAEQRRSGHTLKEIQAMLPTRTTASPADAAKPAQEDEPAFATALELMEVANCSRPTIFVWMSDGLLPQPTRAYLGHQGNHLRFPRAAIAIAAFIAEQRALGVSKAKIREMLQAGLGPPLP